MLLSAKEVSSSIKITLTSHDAPPSFLMDLVASPKLKTTEGEGVGARSLARNTSRVKGHGRAPGWN